MNSEYLIHGANSLKGVLKIVKDENSYGYDRRSVSLFLSYACNILSILEKDEETLHSIVKGSSHKEELSTINISYSKFIEEFLVADKGLMISSGMDKKIVNYLFKDLEKMQRHIITNRHSTVEGLRDGVSDLRNFACSDKSSEIGKKEAVKRTLQVVGGAAIVVVNSTSDSILSLEARGLSQAFGGYVVGKGLDGL